METQKHHMNLKAQDNFKSIFENDEEKVEKINKDFKKIDHDIISLYEKYNTLQFERAKLILKIKNKNGR